MIKKINPAYTQNRELSWLKFNERVLDEAMDETVPLYERLKFLAIFDSNLDEFFMIRVGSLYDLSLENTLKFDNKSFLTPSQQLEKIFAATKKLYKKRDIITAKLEAACYKANIHRKTINKLNKTEQKFVSDYYKTQILPLLSPLIINIRHPFPHLKNKLLYIAASLKEKKSFMLGIIPIPQTLPKLLYLPGRKIKNKKIKYILIEDILLHYTEKIFSAYSIDKKTLICVTRNADISLDDEDFELGEDYLQHMRKSLRKRARLSPVRLEIADDSSSFLTTFLMTHLNIKKEQIFKTPKPINTSYIFNLNDRLNDEQKELLLYPTFQPSLNCDVPDNMKMFNYIRNKDLLLHYPYQSFDLFLNFIKEAVYDESVFAIKMTIYRIGERKAKLIQLLSMAAEMGKDVTVLMELRARFDEANNINWAEMLQDSGCKVIYGMEGYKIHAKICLIMRRHNNKIEYFTQIGTGNYNEQTASLYTDLSLFTAADNIGFDAVQFFQNMGTDNLHGNYNYMLAAPTRLKNNLINLINNEKQQALAGHPAHILLKMNALTDRELIDALANASQAGVNIKMIIRGICCLKPGIKGITENIQVISIVGRFLEHSRIFCFGNGENAKVYISSADWMTRNTEHRVELACPIFDKDIKENIYNELLLLWQDTIKGRLLSPDGNYEKLSAKLPAFNSQESFLKKYLFAE